MEKTVDIVLPTHRRAHTIACSIQSVLQQTYHDFLLHVVGDGCDAATESVVRSFHDPRIRFYRFPKAMGLGYANRNQILSQTSGGYVAYASDDDLWFRDHLERGVTELQNRNLALVAFRSCPVRFPDTPDPYFFAFDWRVGWLSAFLRNWFTGSGTLIHCRWVFDKVGYWNDKLVRFGDREFYNRVRVSGVPTDYIDDITILRFYARHWDHRYTCLDEPPQKRYLTQLQNPQWCSFIRHAAASGSRTFAVRHRQWRDFILFGLGSGPSFLRFWYQELLSHSGRRSAIEGKVRP